MKRTISTFILGGLLAFAIAIPASAVSPRDGGTARATERPDPVQVRQEAEGRAANQRTSAENRRAEIKQKVEERRAQVKQEVCERRQDKLTAAIPRLAQGATSVKSSLDTVYTRVVGFYEKGQLAVANYDELVGVVEVAKANATDALASIDAQSFTLDCDDPNVGEQLDGYRLAAQSARSSLGNYRTALVQLISAMRAPAAQNADASDDSTPSGMAADRNRTDEDGGASNE